MIDIKLIRENPNIVKDSIRRRGLKVDIDELLKLDEQRRAKIGDLEALQAKRNTLAAEVGKNKPSDTQTKLGRELKSQHEQLSGELNTLDKTYQMILSEVPNLIADGTPDGGEEANQELEKWGETRLGFDAKDHLEIDELHGLYDFEAGAKVAGNKFYFTKHKAVRLWQAIQLAAQDILIAAGFELLAVPHMVSSEVAAATGYMPRGQENQNYVDQDQGLVMIATAEIPLTGLHKDDEIKLDTPLMYAATSPCYRLEAGAYGKFSKGLYRTHQFEKLEMYIYCKAEDSEQMLQKILALEKQICETFEIPYRVVRIAAGDLSTPAYEKYDLEYYSPAEKEYRELTSCSNCTDYQARNLNIRYRNEQGQLNYAHTLNGTAVVSSRMPIAILENHQTHDGRIVLPGPIAKYYGADEL